MAAKNPIIIAHRGASFEAPENTLASVNLAWEQGADAVEVDVRFSKDKYPVVIHDSNTRRTTGKKGLVNSLFSRELKQLDAGIWKGSQWQGEEIPLLTEVIATVPSDRKLIVEIKPGKIFIPQLVDVINKSGTDDGQIEFISFDPKICSSLKAVFPKHKVMLLSELDYTWLHRIFKTSTDKLVKTVIDHHLDGLDLWAGRMIDNYLISKCRRHKLMLYTWTVNSPGKAYDLIRLGVDGITTDRVDFLKELISKRIGLA